MQPGRRALVALAAALLAATSAAVSGSGRADAFGSSTPPPGPPSVSAGGYMSCGVRADASTPANHRNAACWGDNVNEGPGQATPPAGVQFSEVNSGYSHACGVRHAPATPAVDRTVICWGSDNGGSSTPPADARFTHVAPAFDFTCGLRHDPAVAANDKTAVCWGANDAGQVGGVPAGVKFTQLTVGIRHACGLRETPVAGRNVVCWGSDDYGQVTNVPPGTFAAVSSGNFDVCVLAADGTPSCWGRNAVSQDVPPPGETFAGITVGFQHICGLRADGTVLCWGRNTEGQALAPLGTFDHVSAGTFHTCATTTAGAAVCWGDNAEGRVEPTMTSSPPPPAAVMGAPYSHLFTSTYLSPRTWAVTSGSLPPGLTLDQSGLLSGTPTVAGTYSDITVTVGNGLAAARQTFSIVVTGATLPDTLPALSIGDVAVHEGDGLTRAAAFTVSLSKPADTTVTVEFTTVDGSGSAPGDYQARSGTLSLAAGSTGATVKVVVVGDGVDETNETFNVALSRPVGALLADGAGTGTVLDDDPAAVTGKRLAIGDVAVHEGDAGARVAAFTVSLSKASTTTVTVNFATLKGTAKGADYTATSGTLRFAAGATSMNVKVQIAADTLSEGSETFAVILSSASGATVVDATGTGTIVDDDGGG